MTGPASFPASSPAIRIRRGETIVALAWSNTATAIFGRFRVLYDSGKEDDFILSLTVLTNGRLTNLVQAGQVANDHGWILSGQMQQQPGVSAQATQRGQCYVRACIVAGGPTTPGALPPASMPECRATICSGYIYSGVDVGVGQLIEPGPTGGSGQIVTASSADPAAGVEVADLVTPAGAIWLLRTYSVQLVQGLTQTPLPSLEFESGAIVAALVPAMTTALGASTTAQLTWALGAVQTSFVAVAGDEQYTAPLPNLYMRAGLVDTVATFTDGIGANTNYGAAVFTYEEWVMPN